MRALGSILRDAGERFMEQGAMRYSAALAFYSTLALAPLIMLVLSLASLLVTDFGTEQMIVGQLDQLMRDQGMQIVEQVLDNVPDASDSVVGLAGSVALLLFGGSVLFFTASEEVPTMVSEAAFPTRTRVLSTCCDRSGSW